MSEMTFVSRLFQSCLKNCKYLMEKIFLKDDEATVDPSPASDQPVRATRHYEASANQDKSDQATPTEVFSVSALYVT